MSKYGEFQGKARAIRILGLVSSGLAVSVLSAFISMRINYTSSIAIYLFAWSIVAIHLLGIALISIGVSLNRAATRTGTAFGIAYRAITFGILMILSFLWVPMVFIGLSAVGIRF